MAFLLTTELPKTDRLTSYIDADGVDLFSTFLGFPFFLDPVVTVGRASASGQGMDGPAGVGPVGLSGSG